LVLSAGAASALAVRQVGGGDGDRLGVFELDDENKSVVVDPDAQDRDAIILASQDCPVDAIFIVDQESGEQLYP